MSKQAVIYILELQTSLKLTSNGYYSIRNLYKAAIASVKDNIEIPIIECGDIEKLLLKESSCYIWKNGDNQWAKVIVCNMEDCNDCLPWLRPT